MVKVIRLFGDMTFEEKRSKAKETKLQIEKEYEVDFAIGRSVFIERWKFINRLMFWRRRRQMVFLNDGSNECMNMASETVPSEKNPGCVEIRPSLSFNFGTRDETRRYVAKVIAKAKADQKPLSTNQFIIIIALLAVIAMLQVMVMKGVKF